MPGVAVKCARLGGLRLRAPGVPRGPLPRVCGFFLKALSPTAACPGVMAELRAGTKRVQKRQPGKAASLLLLLPPALYLNVPSGSSRQGGLGASCPPPGAGDAPCSTGSPLPGGWRGSARSLLCFCGGEFPAAGNSKRVSNLENWIGQNQGRKIKIRDSKVPRQHLGSGGDRAPGCCLPLAGCCPGPRHQGQAGPSREGLF